MKNIIPRFLGLVLIVSLVFEFSQAQTVFWQQSNGPYGGHIWKITTNSQGHLFALSYSRVFKSTNFGSTWQSFSLDSMWVEGLGGICNVSSVQIFLGHKYGVIVSNDEGETWRETGYMPVTTGVRALVADTLGVLFAGTWRQGIFRSNDLGQTWIRCSADSLTVLSFYVNRNANVILAGSQGGIYRSVNGGTIWNFINIGDASVTDIIEYPSGVLYAASSTSTGGLYKSTDDGITWTKLNTMLRYCNSITATISGKLVVGSSWGMYMSDDSGNTWTKKGLSNEIVLTLWFDGNERLYAGTSGSGVYVSNDEGNTWIDRNTGINAARIRALSADNHGNMYVAWHKKIHRSNNYGLTFEESFKSASDEITTVTVDSNSRVYAIVRDTIFISNDYGSTWQIASATDIWQPPWVLAVDSDNNLFTVTRNAAVYRSTNQGSHWINVHGGGAFAVSVNIAFASNKGTGFFTADDRIFRSTDAGLNWSQIGQSLQTNGTQSFCIDRRGVIYLGTNGFGIYRSSDNGESWTEVNMGIPSTDRWVRFIVATGDELLVNTSSYIYPPGYTTYRSTNNGEFWFRESSGLPNDFVTALHATPQGYLFAGTQSNGLYRSYSVISHINSEKEMGEFSLFQNYPNPFNPTTIIKFSLSQNCYTKLKIFNLLGQEIATLVDEELSAGTYQREWNPENLSGGVYFYRLTTGSYSDTKKLILLK